MVSSCYSDKFPTETFTMPDETDPCCQEDTKTIKKEIIEAEKERSTEQGTADLIYRQCAVSPQEMEDAVSFFTKAADEGDPNAQLRLGQMLLDGYDGVCSDPIVGAKYIRMAAGQDIALAQYIMGTLYLSGNGVDKNTEKSIHWLTKASAGGSVQAMLLLGDIYRGWYEYEYDGDKAMEFYSQAAGLGSNEGLARMLMTRLNQENVKNDTIEQRRIFDNLLVAAKNNNPEAAVAIGDIYYDGRLGFRDVNLAKKYYLVAANNKNADGAFRLALMQQGAGQGMFSATKEGMHWLKCAANWGNKYAQFYLGEVYLNAWGTNRDYKSAAFWYQKAADQELVEAYARLADRFFQGLGAPRDVTTAVFYYRKAADAGNPYSLFTLSALHELGMGVAPDLIASARYLKLGMQLPSNQQALCEVAEKFEKGIGFKQDINRAITWYKYAADLDSPIAMAKLGDIYTLVHPEPEKAEYWYSLASEKGLPYGQYSYAMVLVEHRSDDEQIKRNALKLLHHAAYHGYRPAQNELGWLYYTGKLFPKNFPRAFAWMNVAKRNNFEGEPDYLVAMYSEMNPQNKNLGAILTKYYNETYQDKRF